MRSMTLIIFLLLTATAFSQAVEKETKTVVTPPPPLNNPAQVDIPAKAGDSGKLRSARSRKKKRIKAHSRLQSQPRRSSIVTRKQVPERKNIIGETNDPESQAPTRFQELDGQSSDSLRTEQKEAEPMKANERIPFMAEDQPAITEKSTEGSIWMNVLGSIAIVLGLLFVGTWLVKKFGLFGVTKNIENSKSDLELIASVSPRPGQTISVINFNGENLLVGSTDQGFTLLSKQPQKLKSANVTSFPNPVPVSSLLLDSDQNEFESNLELAEKKIAQQHSGGSR